MTVSLPKLSTPWALTRLPGDDDSRHLGERFERWEGRTVPTPWPAAYGGDLSVGMLAAALGSAAEGQLPHSMQIVFLLPGDRDGSLTYEVERVRDGFRYSNRSVRLVQGGNEIAEGSVLLRAPRPGEVHVAPKPQLAGLPDPDSLPSAADAISARGALSHDDGLERYWGADRQLDTRHIDPPLYGEAVAPRERNRVWVRFTGDDATQRALLAVPAGRAGLLAYIADDTILEPAVASLGHGWLAPGLFSTTIQQSIWFHADFDPADWLLFSQRLVSRAGDHVVCQGDMFTREGALVATVVQEGILRVRRPQER